MKNVILVLLVAFYGNLGLSQGIAYAYPLSNIVIDGDLQDWPKDFGAYSITYSYPESKNNNDNPTFQVGYNEELNILYFGVRVPDVGYVVSDSTKHHAEDHALIYLDHQHYIGGGRPSLIVGGYNYTEVVYNWSPVDFQDMIDESDVTLATSYKNGVIYYEWAIRCPRPLNHMDVIGLDHFIVDQDENSNEQTFILWKDGFQKSMGSQAIGDLVIVKSDIETERVEGIVKMKDVSLDLPSELHFINTRNRDLWFKVAIEEDGRFEAVLPKGDYTISMGQLFSSPPKSSGFLQNSKRLDLEYNDTISVGENSTISHDTIVVTTSDLILPEKDSGWLTSSRLLDSEEVKGIISQVADYFCVPTYSICLIQDGEVIYESMEGVTSILDPTPPEAEALFEAASITKAVFALMVIESASKGLIDLDRPLVDYLDFPNFAGDHRISTLTGRMVLGQRSGMKNWHWGYPDGWLSALQDSLLFSPGTDFGYSGEAFNYLGRVLEMVEQRNLNEIFQDYIIERFGLKNTYLFYHDSLRSKTLLGHYQGFPSFKNREISPSPASSLLTNAQDFSKLLLAMLDPNTWQSDALELITSPLTELSAEQRLYDKSLPQYISHGFFMTDRPDGRWIGHGGNNGDYDCKFSINMSTNSGFAIFTNSNMGDEFIRVIEELIYGL